MNRPAQRVRYHPTSEADDAQRRPLSSEERGDQGDLSRQRWI